MQVEKLNVTVYDVTSDQITIDWEHVDPKVKEYKVTLRSQYDDASTDVVRMFDSFC